MSIFEKPHIYGDTESTDSARSNQHLNSHSSTARNSSTTRNSSVMHSTTNLDRLLGQVSDSENINVQGLQTNRENQSQQEGGSKSTCQIVQQTIRKAIRPTILPSVLATESLRDMLSILEQNIQDQQIQSGGSVEIPEVMHEINDLLAQLS